jgi:hypothetical protein
MCWLSLAREFIFVHAVVWVITLPNERALHSIGSRKPWCTSGIWLVADSCRDHPLLQCTALEAREFSWIHPSPPDGVREPGGMRVDVQVRHRMKPVAARVSLLSDAEG